MRVLATQRYGAPTFMQLFQRTKQQRKVRHSAHYERVLGTSLEVQIAGESAAIGVAAESAALVEIERLQRIFNAYDEHSELSCWQQTFDIDVPVSPELCEVLDDAARWQQRTRGVFNAASEAMTRVWREYSQRAETPPQSQLSDLAAQLQKPLWSVNRENCSARRLTHLPITLNSIAKGYVVDSAAQRAAHVAGVEEVLINIGGDLRHIGKRGLQVHIADPLHDAENAPSIDAIFLRDGALATSGNYRRGFQIGEKWHSHVFDPRDGLPVKGVVSASVIAKTAAAADVLATACSVLTVAESLEFIGELENIGVLLIEENGVPASNSFWDAQRENARLR